MCVRGEGVVHLYKAGKSICSVGSQEAGNKYYAGVFRCYCMHISTYKVVQPSFISVIWSGFLVSVIVFVVRYCAEGRSANLF